MRGRLCAVVLCLLLLFFVENYFELMSLRPYPRANLVKPLRCGDLVLFKSNALVQLCTPLQFNHVAICLTGAKLLEMMPAPTNLQVRLVSTATAEGGPLFLRRAKKPLSPRLVALFLKTLEASPQGEYSHLTYLCESLQRVCQKAPGIFLPPLSTGSVTRMHNCSTFLAQLLVFCGALPLHPTQSWLPDDFASSPILEGRYGPLMIMN